MKLWKAVVFALGVGVVSAAITDAKQEHDASYPKTRSWQVAELGHGDNDWYPWTRIDVIDTAGVCLYVSRTNASDGGSTIVAVPKTQLLKGVGCQ
jgi:hypothetical protein